MIYNEIDKFYVTELTKQQFTSQLFAEIDNMPHPLVGTLKVNKTFILERFYLIMSQVMNNINIEFKNKRCKLQRIERLSLDNVQKSIESHRKYL